MDKPYISVIIPTKNRLGLLAWTLREFAKQSLSPENFEIIVSDDGSTDDTQEYIDSHRSDYPFPLVCVRQEKSHGPATARNLGVELAAGTVLLFTGDDCIPSKHLFLRHYLRHRFTEDMAIQGYTEWHPAIPPDDFMRFLLAGPQSNFNALREKDGSWISRDKEIQGWGLTTNYSIKRSTFEKNGGYNESFPEALWEDVEFAFRLAKISVPTYFEPDAINWHYHRQTPDGFSRRQIREGKTRLLLCSLHPELAPHYLPPADLRETTTEMLRQALEEARELHYNQADDVQETRIRRWGKAMQLSSLEGIRQGIKEQGGLWNAIQHLHINDAMIHIAQAVQSLKKGDPHFAQLCMEWAMRAEPNCWALHVASAVVYKALGDRQQALAHAQTGIEMAPDNGWARETYDECLKMGEQNE